MGREPGTARNHRKISCWDHQQGTGLERKSRSWSGDSGHYCLQPRRRLEYFCLRKAKPWGRSGEIQGVEDMEAAGNGGVSGHLNRD